MEEDFNFSYYINYTYEDNWIPSEDYLVNPYIVCCFIIIIICISLPGNCFLLWVLKQEGLRSSADWLLLHLTASDLIFTFTLVPWTVSHIRGSIFGELCCKLVSFCTYLGLYSYITFLTVMTVHRYVVIVHPVFATSVGNRFRLFTHVTCAVAWLISVGFSLPEAYFLCIYIYDSMFTLIFMFLIQIILFFTIPFLVIVFCYARMGITIHKSHITGRHRHNDVSIMFCIVVGFFICWAPYNIFLFLFVLKMLGVPTLGNIWYSVFLISQILAFSHCCLSPLIHIIGENKFRRYLSWSSRGSRRHTVSNQSSFLGQTQV